MKEYSYSMKFGNDFFMVEVANIGKEPTRLISEWLDFHSSLTETNALWPLHFHRWIVARSLSATVQAKWQGWHLWTWILGVFVCWFYRLSARLGFSLGRLEDR